MTFLTIDVGNTNTVCGLFERGTADPVDHWRASTGVNRTADEWLLLLRQFLSWRDVHVDGLEAVVLASVVPAVSVAFRRMCERMGVDLFAVDWQTDTGMPILIDEPREVGADRIANAVAAQTDNGVPTIVVDLGTATTLDVVSAAGEYLGGIILPGVEISLDALFTRAAALRRIELTPPLGVIGKSTVDAVRSGASYGFAAQIDGLCERIEKEIGPCRVVSTGGIGATIAPLSDRIESYDPWLTLRGLALIYQRNAP